MGPKRIQELRSSSVKKYLAGLVLASSLVMAQTPTRIGVINLQAAVPNTQEGQAAVAKLQREFVEPATKKLEAMQGEIRDLTDKLNRGGNTLSETAKNDQQSVITAKTKIFNRAVEDYQADSEENQRKLLDDLSTKMRAVMATYARDNNLAVILDSTNPNSGLIWASDTADITQGIIDAYDKAHPVAGGVPASAAKPAGTTPGAVKPVPPPAKPAATTPGQTH
jgi:Skp family chaperone for outer membrane proteins